MFGKQEVSSSVASAIEAVRRSLELWSSKRLDWLSFRTKAEAISEFPATSDLNAGKHRDVVVSGTLRDSDGTKYEIHGFVSVHVYFAMLSSWEPGGCTDIDVEVVVFGNTQSRTKLCVQWERSRDPKYSDWNAYMNSRPVPCMGDPSNPVYRKLHEKRRH